MAASIGVMSCRKNLSVLSKQACKVRVLCCRRLTEVAVDQKDEPTVVKYPPIRGRYPPGAWGDMAPREAWYFYEKGNELDQITDVKRRLEAYAGSQEHYFHHVTSAYIKPKTFEYNQYISKTHVLKEDFPEKDNTKFKDIDTDALKETLRQDFMLHNSQFSNSLAKGQFEKALMKRVFHKIMHSLSYTCPYLLSSQVDEATRIESFWWRKGNEESKDKKGTYFSLLSYQYAEKAVFHLRTEKPTPLFVEEDHELCTKPSVECEYSPKVFGQPFKWMRPITTCGAWIGDPCEFSHLSFYMLPKVVFEKYVRSYGLDATQDVLCTYALNSAFGACLSQAHNQGFHAFRDLTYPLTTQTVVYSGGYLYFTSYQLNTLRLWLNDEANPKSNIAWISGPHELFTHAEDGSVEDYNTDTLNRLIQCFCLEPQDRGVEMRPYAEDGGPLENKPLINIKGEPLIERPKIGRYEYPANAVYY